MYVNRVYKHLKTSCGDPTKSHRTYVRMCVCKIQLPDPRLTFAALFCLKMGGNTLIYDAEKVSRVSFNYPFKNKLYKNTRQVEFVA